MSQLHVHIVHDHPMLPAKKPPRAEFQIPVIPVSLERFHIPLRRLASPSCPYFPPISLLSVSLERLPSSFFFVSFAVVSSMTRSNLVPVGIQVPRDVRTHEVRLGSRRQVKTEQNKPVSFGRESGVFLWRQEAVSGLGLASGVKSH